MSLSFPTYFLTSAIKASGWPRKKYFFGRTGVSGAACAGIWPSMVQAAAALGVARPVVACQLLTHLFGDRDWAAGSGDDFLDSLDRRHAIELHAPLLPWASILHEELKYFESHQFIDVNVLFSDGARLTQSMRFGEGLCYGIRYPRNTVAELDRERSLQIASSEVARKHGLKIPPGVPWVDNAAYFQWLGEILLAYEASNGKLPVAHPSLIASESIRTRLSF